MRLFFLNVALHVGKHKTWLNTRSSIKFEKFALKIECFSTKFLIEVPRKQLKLKKVKKNETVY